MRNRDLTQREIADMDNFLDNHPEIAEQLRKDPSLIDNKQFVANHPALQEYLQSHPEVREEFRENPNAFMHAEHRYERQENGRSGDNGITRKELADMDRFLDSHPEIAEQLKKDPSLIDNRKFVENHPALQEYLHSHPEVREEFRENPNAFMHAEDRYDQREEAREGDRGHDRDFDRREMSNFGEFLRGHSTMADALSHDPTLANDREFLETHPDLQQYLKAHPGVQQQLVANPQVVMTSPALAGTAAPPRKELTTSPKPEPPTIKPEPQH
jgi:YHS domain-containing protein